MRFSVQKRMAFVLALMLSVTFLATCYAAGDSAVSDTTVSLTILSPDDGRIVVEDNPVWLELEKRTNTQLNLMLLPGGELSSKLNTMAASNTLPDIIKYSDFFPYVEQGVVVDITDIIADNAPNLLTHIPASVWEYTMYKGRSYAIPYYNEAGKSVMAIRQDWLDQLNLDVPQTLDDLYEVAVKFANEDPDGNGKKDSYAFANWYDFMPIFCGYGILGPFSQNDNRYFYIEDNQAYCAYTSPYFKDAMTYINKLWSENLIDPDFMIMKNDQYQQKLVQSKVGMLTAWWSIVPETLMKQLGFQTVNPDAAWTIVSQAPIGPGGPMGDHGMRSFGDYQNATWISSSSKHPVEAVRFLDYLMGDEGMELATYGLQGVHYTSIVEGRTAEGTKAFDEKWLDSFAQIVGKRIDVSQMLRDVPTSDPDVARSLDYQKAGLSYPLYKDVFFGLPTTEADLAYGADLANFEVENRIAFLTGERSLDEYDAYVQEWYERGGREILEDKVALYNEIKGTDVVAAGVK